MSKMHENKTQANDIFWFLIYIYYDFKPYRLSVAQMNPDMVYPYNYSSVLTGIGNS